MANVYYDSDANLDLIKNETIAIIGYGSQGHAHALNLRDSGCDVIVGLYEGSKSWAQAEKDGLKVATSAEAARQAQTVMIAIHDHLHKPVFEESIRPHMTAGKTLMVAHGFSVHYTQLVPPADIDVTLVAPKSPGHILRREYTKGMGVPGLVAIHQDVTGRAKDRALAYAKGIGCTRSGVIETTFGEETETDLFGEQAVLCGGITALIKAGFETLVEAGYQPELAYFECLNEMKLIVDLIWEGGLGLMRYSVSDTAEYGDYTAGPKIFDEHVRETLRKLLKDIQDGTFAKEWILENQAGRPQFNTARRTEKEHQIEKVGAELRAMMTWAKTIY